MNDSNRRAQSLSTDCDDYVDLAEQIIARRRARRRLLPQGMLVDVAWDLLLYIFAARGNNGHTTTAAIARAVEQSPTVAARWLSLLQADGLVAYREGIVPPCWDLSESFLLKLMAYLRENYDHHGAGPETAGLLGVDG